jgi:GNAT superfamily N-acetyltransferase
VQIRPLDPVADRGVVWRLLERAADYYRLWKGRAACAADVDEIFENIPPGCDPALSHRLGFFEGAELVGVAELSFGFPAESDAYLGLMILAPHARSRGLGPLFLAEVEAIARQHGAPALYLAVLEQNPRGRAFWARSGFTPTGVQREMVENGIHHRLFRLKKPL